MAINAINVECLLLKPYWWLFRMFDLIRSLHKTMMHKIFKNLREARQDWDSSVIGEVFLVSTLVNWKNFANCLFVRDTASGKREITDIGERSYEEVSKCFNDPGINTIDSTTIAVLKFGDSMDNFIRRSCWNKGTIRVGTISIYFVIDRKWNSSRKRRTNADEEIIKFSSNC